MYNVPGGKDVSGTTDGYIVVILPVSSETTIVAGRSASPMTALVEAMTLILEASTPCSMGDPSIEETSSGVSCPVACGAMLAFRSGDAGVAGTQSECVTLRRVLENNSKMHRDRRAQFKAVVGNERTDNRPTSDEPLGRGVCCGR